MAASKTCLVIDNVFDFAGFVRKVAEGIGFVTRVLTDPRRLEETLLTNDPDVITLDMDMPHRSGLDVLRTLASRQLADRVIIISGTPPIFVAGKTCKTCVNDCKVVAVLTKPARKFEIEAALAGAVVCSP